ncbi:MAG: hypothetical protein R3355_20350 [Pseudomonas sp.]|uniref:hypothetical protein n=1 Tax=Pseudomonas sp. TaxID=306 RepID=UPI00299D616A|nr:hypothetical protein [Pseudomonas sp.]MDX1725447.1 hypothetical protein [Pseudomonas sp.]
MPSHSAFTLRDYHAQDLQALVELFSASVHQLSAEDAKASTYLGMFKHNLDTLLMALRPCIRGAHCERRIRSW